MESLYIKATEQTPEIDFKTNGEFTIKGVSLPENIFEFYEPTMNWLELFEKNLPKEVSLTLNMEYFNTGSSGILKQIITKIVSFDSPQCKVKVTWMYEDDDDDMISDGEKLQYTVKFNFIFLKIS